MLLQRLNVSLSKAADKMMTQASRLGNRKVLVDEDSIKKMIARLQSTHAGNDRQVPVNEAEVVEETVRPKSAAFISSAPPHSGQPAIIRRGSV